MAWTVEDPLVLAPRYGASQVCAALIEGQQSGALDMRYVEPASQDLSDRSDFELGRVSGVHQPSEGAGAGPWLKKPKQRPSGLKKKPGERCRPGEAKELAPG